jgi:hypothetical protein
MFIKVIVHMDKGACSMAGIPSDTLKDMYLQSIDNIGVMLNTHSTPAQGKPVFWHHRFIAKVEMLEPLPMPRAAMPPPMPPGVLRRQ